MAEVLDVKIWRSQKVIDKRNFVKIHGTIYYILYGKVDSVHYIFCLVHIKDGIVFIFYIIYLSCNIWPIVMAQVQHKLF